MFDEERVLAIEEYSTPVTREGENIVTLCGYLNKQQIPEWAYLKLLSNSIRVEKATQSSDCLRIRIGYRDGQSAGTLISRVFELEKRIEIESISITPHEQLESIKFAVIADICYSKDNIDGLLYVTHGHNVGFLDATNNAYVRIIK